MARHGVGTEGSFDFDHIGAGAGDFADEGDGAGVAFEDGGEGF